MPYQVVPPVMVFRKFVILLCVYDIILYYFILYHIISYHIILYFIIFCLSYLIKLYYRLLY